MVTIIIRQDCMIVNKNLLYINKFLRMLILQSGLHESTEERVGPVGTGF